MGETCGLGSGVIQHLEVRCWEGKDNEEDPASETKEQHDNGAQYAGSQVKEQILKSRA